MNVWVKTGLRLVFAMTMVSGCSRDEAATPASEHTPTEVTSVTALPTSTPLATATESIIPTATVDDFNASGSIVFYSHRDGNPEIYTMQADGSNPRRITLNEAADDSPAWSPNGSQIAYIFNRDDPNPGGRGQDCLYQLYLINTDGGESTGWSPPNSLPFTQTGTQTGAG